MVAAIELDLGCSSEHYIRKRNGRAEFVKKYLRPHLSTLRSLESKIIPNDAFHKHLAKDYTNSGYNQELKTWNLWKNAGIKSLDLIKSEEGEIVWEYLAAPSARLYLEESQNSFEEKVFSNYLEVYSKIRNTAKEKNDSNILHNDPWLKNYLVSNEEVIPIDPGVKFRADLSVEELDVALNRISLCSITNLSVNENIKRNYIEMFRETLTDTEAIKVMDFNSLRSLPERIYLNFRENIVSSLRGRPKIDIDLRSKNFEKAKRDYIQDIF